MNVNHSARAGGILGYIIDFLLYEICCMFSLESPHRGNSNDNTQYHFQYEKKITLNFPKSAAMNVSMGLKTV